MMQMLGDLTGIGNQAAARQDSMEYMNKEEQERIAEEIRYAFYMLYFEI